MRLTEKGKTVDRPFIYTGVEQSGEVIPRVRAVELGANKNNPQTMHLHWGPYEVVDGSRFNDPFGMRRR